MVSVAAYKRQLIDLLPRGRLFDALGENFQGLLEGIAEELQLAQDYLDGARAETNPSTAVYTLAEWEAKYNLASNGTDAERKARILARRAARRRVRPVDYQERFAPMFGIASSQVAVIEIRNALAVYTGIEREVYRFFVLRDPFLGGSFVLADADELIDDFVQSHIKGHVIRSTCLRCDDPNSLPDRDLLEAPEYMVGRAVPFASNALLWFRGDDPGATFDGSGFFATIPNGGTLGGSVVPATGTGPEVSYVGGKRAARTTTNGGFSFAGTASLSALHDPASNAIVAFVAQVDNPAAAGRFLCTRNFSPTGARGVMLELSGSKVSLTVGDGTSNTVSTVGAVNVTTGKRLMLLRKTGLLFEWFVDGVLHLSATASALTAGAHATAAQIGSSSTDTGIIAGSIAELSVHSFTAFSGTVEFDAIFSYYSHSYFSGAPWVPDSLLWLEGDDKDAAFTVDFEFSSLTNRGYLGGAATKAATLGPGRTRVNGKWSTNPTANGGLRFGSTASLKTLHDPTSSATITILVRVDAYGVARIFGTRETLATAGPGVMIETTSTGIRIVAGNGSTDTLTLTGAALEIGWHVVQVTKAALAFAVFVDGFAYLSGSASTLSTADQASVATVGSALDGTLKLAGLVPAVGVHPWAMSAQELEQVRLYCRRWLP